ncbi:hypothetical protein H4Q26_000197 [Puccinia striiformis f. sp. tritici PST-130]|nr:hypothetical protein H4Q26_000197 [Puccinia striiformis f. sp. tritici PST-130]
MSAWTLGTNSRLEASTSQRPFFEPITNTHSASQLRDLLICPTQAHHVQTVSVAVYVAMGGGSADLLIRSVDINSRWELKSLPATQSSTRSTSFKLHAVVILKSWCVTMTKPCVHNPLNSSRLDSTPQLTGLTCSLVRAGIIKHTAQKGKPGGARVVKFSPAGPNELLAFTEHQSLVHVLDARTFDPDHEEILAVPTPPPGMTPFPARHHWIESVYDDENASSASRRMNLEPEEDEQDEMMLRGVVGAVFVVKIDNLGRLDARAAMLPSSNPTGLLRARDSIRRETRNERCTLTSSTTKHRLRSESKLNLNITS